MCKITKKSATHHPPYPINFGEGYLGEAEDVEYGKRYLDEEKLIVEKAKADGTYMKAPNGEPTKLTEKQWAQVRTKAFKQWFGDWEKSARIEKLRKAKAIEITGEEIAPSDDLKQYKKNALDYGKALRGEYTNKDTGGKSTTCEKCLERSFTA